MTRLVIQAGLSTPLWESRDKVRFIVCTRSREASTEYTFPAWRVMCMHVAEQACDKHVARWLVNKGKVVITLCTSSVAIRIFSFMDYSWIYV